MGKPSLQALKKRKTQGLRASSLSICTNVEHTHTKDRSDDETVEFSQGVLIRLGEGNIQFLRRVIQAATKSLSSKIQTSE